MSFLSSHGSNGVIEQTEAGGAAGADELLVRRSQAGERGSGHSRFLEACVLDAKLQGYMGLRADAEDGAAGDYGSLQRILRQLQQLAPELAQPLLAAELPVLGIVMPALLAGQAVPLASFAHPSALRAAVQEATQRVLLAAAECTPLLIAIDDLPRCDDRAVKKRSEKKWQ
jgi:hypothetical protein